MPLKGQHLGMSPKNTKFGAFSELFFKRKKDFGTKSRNLDLMRPMSITPVFVLNSSTSASNIFFPTLLITIKPFPCFTNESFSHTLPPPLPTTKVPISPLAPVSSTKPHSPSPNTKCRSSSPGLVLKNA